MLTGIDISHYQGTPNFDQLKQSTSFIIAQASFGTGYVDPQFKRNQAEMRRVNVLRGFYHYAYPEYNPDPTKEAAWFLSVVGELQQGEVLALDFEEQYSGDKVAWVKGFLDYIAQHTNGYKPLLYIALSWANDPKLDWSPVYNAGYGLWVAWYNYDPNNNNFNVPWSEAAMRQYANNVKPSGLATITDGDIFFGDPQAFLKYGIPATAQPIDYQKLAKQIKDEVNNMDNDNIKVIKIKELVANV